MTDHSLFKGYKALKNRDLKAAHSEFSHVIKEEKDKTLKYKAALGLGLVHRELGDLEKALEFFDQAKDMAPNPKEALFNLANTYEEMGNHALAIQNYDLVIAMAPTMQEAYLNRGVAWYNMRKHAEGIKDFKNTLTTGKDRSRALSNLGITFLDQELYEKAIDHFDRALELDPTNIHSLCGKGLALYHLDRYDDSMICFDAAASINPDFYIAHYYKGRILKGLDLLDEAKESIEKAIEVREEFPLAWFELGEILRANRDYKGALNAYEKASRYHHGTYEESLFQMARLHSGNGDHGKALKDLKRICKTNSKVGKVWLEMAKVLLKMKEEEKAVKALKNAQFLIPSNSEVANLLARHLIKREQYQKAKGILKRAMEGSPNPEIGLLLSNLQKNLEDYSDAIITCEEVLSMDTERIEAWLIMGRSYGALGKTEEYKQCLRKYLHKRPEDRSVEDEMRSIN